VNIRKYPATYSIEKTMERMGIKRTALEDRHRKDEALGYSFWAPPRHQDVPGAKWRYYVADVENWLLRHEERKNGPPAGPVEAHEAVRA